MDSFCLPLLLADNAPLIGVIVGAFSLITYGLAWVLHFTDVRRSQELEHSPYNLYSSVYTARRSMDNVSSSFVDQARQTLER